jgi:hypothetical protein
MGCRPGCRGLISEWFAVNLDAGDVSFQHQWWVRQQGLAVVGLRELAKFFQLVRPSLRRIDLVRSEPPFDLMPPMQKKYMMDDEGMKAVVLEYEARGIELRLRD